MTESEVKTKSLTITHEQKSKIMRCHEYSRLLLYKEGGDIFLDVSKLFKFYENGYRPIDGDLWLGMRMCHDLVDLELTDDDKLVKLEVSDD